jgi:hypothetical protein
MACSLELLNFVNGAAPSKSVRSTLGTQIKARPVSPVDP